MICEYCGLDTLTTNSRFKCKSCSRMNGKKEERKPVDQFVSIFTQGMVVLEDEDEIEEEEVEEDEIEEEDEF